MRGRHTLLTTSAIPLMALRDKASITPSLWPAYPLREHLPSVGTELPQNLPGFPGGHRVRISSCVGSGRKTQEEAAQPQRGPWVCTMTVFCFTQRYKCCQVALRTSTGPPHLLNVSSFSDTLWAPYKFSLAQEADLSFISYYKSLTTNRSTRDY